MSIRHGNEILIVVVHLFNLFDLATLLQKILNGIFDEFMTGIKTNSSPSPSSFEYSVFIHVLLQV